MLSRPSWNALMANTFVGQASFLALRAFLLQGAMSDSVNDYILTYEYAVKVAFFKNVYQKNSTLKMALV